MISHKVLLPNRYGERNYLVPIDAETFLIQWENLEGHLQVHYADNEYTKIKAIDPSGGPLIGLGYKILEWEVTEIFFRDKEWYLKVKKRDDLFSNNKQ